MLGFTALEKRLILYALLLVGIVGYTLYERHSGASAIIVKDRTAELLQSQKDTDNEKHIVSDLQEQLFTISTTQPPVAPMRMCNTSSRMPQRPTTASVEPATLPVSRTDSSVQTRTQSGVDIGPIVQDIALSGVLAATNALDLWKLAQEETRK